MKVRARWPFSDSHDPFEQLAIDFILQGIDPQGKVLVDAWHLDKHVGGASTDVHPLYHFQHGGRHFDALAFNVGDAMLLSGPRLLHPPMEAILAVDFVLGQFDGATWQKFREDGTIGRQVGEAQKDAWVPHFAALASAGASAALLFPFVK